MIRLRDILREFDFGDRLLADPDGGYAHAPRGTGAQYRPHDVERYKRIIGTPYEPNTPEEGKLFMALKQWFRGQQWGELSKWLIKLLPYKDRFPEILDPAAAKFNKAEESYYRCTVINWMQLRELTWRQAQSGALISDTPFTFKSLYKDATTKTTGREEPKGFLSFTPTYKQAVNFFHQIPLAKRLVNSGDNYYRRSAKTQPIFQFLEDPYHRDIKFGVILEIDIDEPNLIMNPDISGAIGGFDHEAEVIHVGTEIKVKRVYLLYFDEMLMNLERAFSRSNEWTNTEYERAQNFTKDDDNAIGSRWDRVTAREALIKMFGLK